MNAPATILLFGKNGQIGWELQRALAPLARIIALGRADADFERTDGLRAIVEQTRPSIVVNAAGYTAVDAAEDERERAATINAHAPRILAEACDRIGAWLIHYSTDYVFDGALGRAYREDDSCSPLNSYGQSKRAGELAIESTLERHIILRTSWVYAARGENFLKAILRAAAKQESVRVVADQYGAPTGAELIADVTAQIVGRLGSTPDPAGIYHLAAAGTTTWHGYAQFVVGRARELGAALRVGPEAVQAVSAASWSTRARRPANSVLDCGKLTSRFELHLPDWQTGVARALEEIGIRERWPGGAAG